MDINLKGKVALVAGASQGLGYAVALAGLLNFGYVYFTMPRHNRGLVVSASFSNEREE
jgi:NAD(P)-dependent dehydrogenase (short-subunit alcohol dehydrogenase family)